MTLIMKKGWYHTVSLINIYRKVFSLFFACALLFTGGINCLFTGDVYKCESMTSVVGLESLVRAQGVTNDGENFIFSGKNALEKVSADGKEVLALNASAIPAMLKEQFGSKHIGGISCYDGIVYAAVEDSDVWQHPLIVLYDADTLEYTGKYFELPVSLQTRGVPWVAVDGENGTAYTGDSRNYTGINLFSLSDFSYLDTVTLSEEIRKIQGGEVCDGKLYVGSNDITRACYAVDTVSGEVTKLFDRIAYEYKLIDNFGGEGEDLTVFPAKDGTFIHTLQTGALFVDITLRHYKTEN